VTDQYPADLAHPGLAKAQELYIGLILVPRGGMAIHQPLDRRVYGAMKSKARGKFDRLRVFDSEALGNKEMVAKFARECWIELTMENIFDAWISRELSAIASAVQNSSMTRCDPAGHQLTFLTSEFSHCWTNSLFIQLIRLPKPWVFPTQLS
jgi:hypothetical protein